MADRIKQILTFDISELISIAKNNNINNDIDIARWIISVSPYWRTKGYDEIIRAINKK